MRVPMNLTSLLVLAFAGCAGDASTAPVAPRDARLLAAHAGAAEGATVVRPWKGRCDVEADITGPTTIVINGTCELAHLGRATVVTEETMDWALGTFTNTSTYTAANGDRLYTSGSGAATFGSNGTGTLVGTWTAVGGTGRFAGASGSAAYAESARITGPTTAEGTYTLDGQLDY
jgi:hypothetical protein